MKYILILLIFYSTIFADDLLIKCLKTTKQGAELQPAVIIHGEKLKIEFDVQSRLLPDLIIVFRFCDKNWKPVDNIFLKNNGYDIERNLWFDKLPHTVSGADYHYKDLFPNNNVTFPYSGKWRYFITDYQDTSIVFGEGKFIYLHDPIPIYTDLKRERIEGRTLEESTFGQVYNITTKFVLPDSLEDFRLQHVEIIENNKFEYPIIINKDYTSDTRYFEWNSGNRYQFTARDIQPGKEYRQADIRDRNKYTPPYTNAHFDGIDVSSLFDKRGKDNNGGFLLNDYRNEYSDYMNVTFELRLPESIDSDVYLVGAFTNWNVYPGFKMYIDDDEIYYLTVELKRGIYDYMYVTGEEDNYRVNEINWLAIEGNSWDTKNDYYIFVYYRSGKKGEYDKIIGYEKISSGR